MVSTGEGFALIKISVIFYLYASFQILNGKKKPLSPLKIFRMAPCHAPCLVIDQQFQHLQFVMVFFIAEVGMEPSDYGVLAITVL